MGPEVLTKILTMDEIRDKMKEIFDRMHIQMSDSGNLARLLTLLSEQLTVHDQKIADLQAQIRSMEEEASRA